MAKRPDADPSVTGGHAARRGRVRFVVPAYSLRGVGLLAAAAVLPLLPLSLPWILPFIGILVMAGGIALGPVQGIVLAVLAALFALFEQRPASPDLALAIGFTPLIAAAVGGSIGLVLRRVSRAAERSARRARLLSQALLRLPALGTPEAVYRELLLWLREILGFTVADVLVPSPDGQHLQVQATLGWAPPPGVTLPMRSVTGRAFLTRQVQHVTDTQADPDFVQGVGFAATHSELALPILVGDGVTAVLNIERATPGGFLHDEIDTLEALVLAVGDALARLGNLSATQETTRLQNFLLDFSRQITQLGTPQAVAQRALQLLLPFAGADFGQVWLPGGGTPHLLASHALGDFEPPDVAPPCLTAFKGHPPREPLWVAASLTSPYSTARQLEAGLQSFAVVPLFNPDGRPQAALELLYYRSPASFAPPQREALQRVADRLHIALQGILVTSRLADLLDALHALGTISDIQDLCDHALAAAIRLVPGADAATLWLADHGGFELRAGSGYSDSGPPPHWTIQCVSDALAWYGGEEAAFRRGLPRVVEIKGMPAQADAKQVAPGSSLFVPLVLHGDLIGLLMVDSLQLQDAFAQDALSIAGMFGLQLAVLLSQGRHRSALAVAARTDTLTGLGNRRDFDERIAAEWSESHRYHQPLSLVILDLQGFKAINDRYGHVSGDEALVAVAKSLNAVRRDGDTVFRWGGDEFSILLTHAELSQALQAASRYLDAVRAQPVLSRDGQDAYVGARVGVASAPEDADSIEGLVRVADERVIMAKRLGQSLSPTGPPRR